MWYGLEKSSPESIWRNLQKILITFFFNKLYTFSISWQKVINWKFSNLMKCSWRERKILSQVSMSEQMKIVHDQERIQLETRHRQTRTKNFEARERKARDWKWKVLEEKRIMSIDVIKMLCKSFKIIIESFDINIISQIKSI